MIVGEGEAERYLDPVLDRVTRWADKVHIALEPDAKSEEFDFVGEYADSITYLRVSSQENDGMAKNQAWIDAAQYFHPTEDDHIAVVKPTEVILDPDAVRKASKEYPGKALRVRLCHLWDEDHIRIDGAWAPQDETMFIPFVHGASYPDHRLRAGRLPMYHHNVPYAGVPVTYALDYDMMSFEDKLRKHEWYETVQGSDFWSVDHIQSIQRTPELRIWKRGGVLNVGEADRRGNTRTVAAG